MKEWSVIIGRRAGDRFLVAILDQLVLTHAFLLLHASVLEPDLDLSFVQRQRPGYLQSAGARQVAVEVKLFFEFGQLFVGEVCTPRIVVVVVVVTRRL